jgi:lysyl-tRNA synthetase class 2
MLEWYRAAEDYNMLMSDCETVIRKVACTVAPIKSEINLDLPWERLTVRDAFMQFSCLTMEQAIAYDRFDEVMTTDIEPNLGMQTPTFLCDYPAERAALARTKPGEPELAERFELYIAGIELANGFSELTDAAEQRRRFAEEEMYRRSHGRGPYPEPTCFLEELASMPPSAGIALGIDRLVMLMLGASCIDEVVAFTPEIL